MTEVLHIVFKMARPKSKKTEKKELDEMWSFKVRTRDNFTCQICGKKLEKRYAQAHHILPRTLPKVRWDVNNGITLCYNHHKVGSYSAHNNAIWFTFWLKTNKPKQFKYIINKITEMGRVVK